MSRDKIAAKLSRIAKPDYVEVHAGIPGVLGVTAGYAKARPTKEEADRILDEQHKANEVQDREAAIRKLQAKHDTPRSSSRGRLRQL